MGQPGTTGSASTALQESVAHLASFNGEGASAGPQPQGGMEGEAAAGGGAGGMDGSSFGVQVRGVMDGGGVYVLCLVEGHAERGAITQQFCIASHAYLANSGCHGKEMPQFLTTVPKDAVLGCCASVP